jgi:uncharacterized glyoxalase superfamily protein PhnB
MAVVYQRAVPILRIFDEPKAVAHYVDFLGFAEVFRHQFAPDLPWYIGLERDGIRLHLSEHAGDGSPGASVRIEVDDVDALAALLNAKKYRYSRPGVVEQPWGSRDMTIADPFGNRLTFSSPANK